MTEKLLMVKVFRTIVVLVISSLILFQGSASAKIDTSMIGVKKYQKFDYLQTKFIGNPHPSFQIDSLGGSIFPYDFLSPENHTFSLKIKDITTLDTSNSILSCEYSRGDIKTDSMCPLDGLFYDSPFVYVDWEYWEDFLLGIVAVRNSTSTFEIINDDNIFGYTWDSYGFDPLNLPFVGKTSVSAIYNKHVGNIIKFSRSSTNSEQDIENAFAYEFVSVSIEFDLNFIQLNMYGLIGFLIILVILIYLLYRKVKKELVNHKILDTS